MEKHEGQYDVIVVGGGNAALCAAITASDEGARVLLLERSPEEKRGGNSSYTEGLMRFVYNGADDIKALSPDLTEEEMKSDFGTYTEEQFFDDMARVTQSRTDPDLCEILVRGSHPTMHWMKDKGVRWLPQFGRQSFKVEGKYTFWGGATLAAWGGGRGLVDTLYKAAEKAGVQVLYNAWAKDLLHSDSDVHGVVATINGSTHEIAAKNVILACGGFEANAAWRARHLGPGWDLAKVRGSKYNMGDGLDMAMRIGAQPAGHSPGCHSVGWERYAADFGDFSVTDDYERDGYPFCITFGGLRITTEGQVVDTGHQPIPGLYAAGEMVGGLFYFNYPGSTGLMSGAVFGRLAGRSAAAAAKLAKAA